MLTNEPYPTYAQVREEGPWEGLEAVLPDDEGLPKGFPRSILKLAQENGWGFGPITMVYRINHPAPGIPPFYMGWVYDIETGKWSFDGARDKTGKKLTLPAIRAMLPMANLAPKEKTDD